MIDYIGRAGVGQDRRDRTEESALSKHEPAVTADGPRKAMSPASGTNDSDVLLSAILASLEDDKAEDLISIPLDGKSEMADHMVVASGRSSRQVVSISEKLAEQLKHDHGLIVRIEGKDTGDWVLIDAGDVIVHVFRPEVRDFYQIEKMWMSDSAAKPRSVGEPA